MRVCEEEEEGEEERAAHGRHTQAQQHTHMDLPHICPKLLCVCVCVCSHVEM